MADEAKEAAPAEFEGKVEPEVKGDGGEGGGDEGKQAAAAVEEAAAATKETVDEGKMGGGGEDFGDTEGKHSVPGDRAFGRVLGEATPTHGSLARYTLYSTIVLCDAWVGAEGVVGGDGGEGFAGQRGGYAGGALEAAWTGRGSPIGCLVLLPPLALSPLLVLPSLVRAHTNSPHFTCNRAPLSLPWPAPRRRPLPSYIHLPPRHGPSRWPLPVAPPGRPVSYAWALLRLYPSTPLYLYTYIVLPCTECTECTL